MRVYPQLGFSVAILTTNAASSAPVRGRPGLRRSMKVHLRATSSRCQRNNVSGVTIVPSSRSVLHPTALAFFARFRRSASVKMMRRSPNRSRSTRFSAPSYSITAACWRCNQPATTISRNCSRVVEGVISRQCSLLALTTSTVTTQLHGSREPGGVFEHYAMRCGPRTNLPRLCVPNAEMNEAWQRDQGG